MSEQQKLKEAARLIKEMCSKRKRCKGCIFYDVGTVSNCQMTDWPDRWEVERSDTNEQIR